jgi:hypothetical protein
MTFVGATVAVLAFLTSCGFDWARIGMSVVAALVGGVLTLMAVGTMEEHGSTGANTWSFAILFLGLPALGHLVCFALLLSPWMRAWQNDIRKRNDQLV